MHNVDLEYGHMLDCKEFQHSVGSLFEGMHFQTKEEVQNSSQ